MLNRHATLQIETQDRRVAGDEVPDEEAGADEDDPDERDPESAVHEGGPESVRVVVLEAEEAVVLVVGLPFRLLDCVPLLGLRL